MEYRVKVKGDRAKVEIGAELLCKGEEVNTKTGRGVASPRPSWDRRTSRSLAPARERSSREVAR
jgi:hypothetical protein